MEQSFNRVVSTGAVLSCYCLSECLCQCLIVLKLCSDIVRGVSYKQYFHSWLFPYSGDWFFIVL